MKIGSILLLSIILAFAPQSVCAVHTFPKSLADSLINQSIQDTIIPGAVLCVVEDGAISYLQAYGNLSVFEEVETPDVNSEEI